MLPTLHRIVAVLPLLVPAAVAVLLAGLVPLGRRRAVTAGRVVTLAVASAYAVSVVGEAFLPVALVVGTARDALAPPTVFLQLVPVVTSLDDPVGIALNVVLFVPLGVLAPLVVLRRATLGGVALVGAVGSLGIEAVQFLLDVTISTGRVADVDDLLGNTAGAVLGWVLLRVLLTVPAVRRAAAACAMPWSRLSGAWTRLTGRNRPGSRLSTP